jgi:predicted DCC family thiol-disulfide oxidoreductase YuxK
VTQLATADAPILVYDGDCAFCSRAVQFVLKHDHRRGTLRFAARTGEAGRAVRVRHAELANVDSLVWVELRDGAERTRVHADAVLAVAEYLGGHWRWFGRTARLIPRPLRDLAYRIIARVRKRVVRGAPVCLVLPPEARAREMP